LFLGSKNIPSKTNRNKGLKRLNKRQKLGNKYLNNFYASQN